MAQAARARAVVLVTGMSGAGKSTVLAALARRGHRVLDTDAPGWTVRVPTDGGWEPMWDLDKVTGIVDRHREGWLFVAGCVANQGALRHRFDAVVLLTAPLPVLLQRVAHRDNPYGSTAADREAIARDVADVEPLLRKSADVEITTDVPPDDVADTLERIAAGF